MKRWRGSLAWILGACMLTVGCERHYYPPPPPPPPYSAVPPLVQQAEQHGFRLGMDDGARDAVRGWGYHPRNDRNFAETPGYDPQFGPLHAYRKYFRNAYARGYYQGFYRR